MHVQRMAFTSKHAHRHTQQLLNHSTCTPHTACGMALVAPTCWCLPRTASCATGVVAYDRIDCSGWVTTSSLLQPLPGAALTVSCHTSMMFLADEGPLDCMAPAPPAPALVCQFDRAALPKLQPTCILRLTVPVACLLGRAPLAPKHPSALHLTAHPLHAVCSIRCTLHQPHSQDHAGQLWRTRSAFQGRSTPLNALQAAEARS